MSDQGNKNPDSIYYPPDDLMLEGDQEAEDTQFRPVGLEGQDQDYSSYPRESGSEGGENSEDDLDSKQKHRERINRSRLNSFSSNKSQSSAGNQSVFGSLKELDKASR